jgi:hypothetical protein
MLESTPRHSRWLLDDVIMVSIAVVLQLGCIVPLRADRRRRARLRLRAAQARGTADARARGWAPRGSHVRPARGRGARSAPQPPPLDQLHAR